MIKTAESRPLALIVGLLLFSFGMISIVFSIQSSGNYDPAGGFTSSWMMGFPSCLAVALSGILIAYSMCKTKLVFAPILTFALAITAVLVLQDRVSDSYVSWAKDRYGVSIVNDDALLGTAGDTVRLTSGDTAKVIARDDNIFLGVIDEPALELPRHSKYAE